MRGDYMLSAVVRAVTNHFGTAIKVYKERPAQNAPGEYLFVHQINREQTPDNFRFHNRYYFFDVRYHPDDKQGTQYQRIAEIGEELSECLYRIETDDQPARASSMRGEVQDGVLHFFVDYPMRVMEQLQQEPLMEQLDIEEKLKE